MGFTSSGDSRVGMISMASRHAELELFAQLIMGVRSKGRGKGCGSGCSSFQQRGAECGHSVERAVCVWGLSCVCALSCRAEWMELLRRTLESGGPVGREHTLSLMAST